MHAEHAEFSRSKIIAVDLNSEPYPGTQQYRYRYVHVHQDLSLVKLPVLNLVPVLTLVRVQVPVLVLFFNINIYGPKNHFWPHMQAGWARAGHTFGLFFWPHVQLKVVFLPKSRYLTGAKFAAHI